MIDVGACAAMTNSFSLHIPVIINKVDNPP